MVTDSIENDPNYGQELELWIYSLISNKWVRDIDPTYPSGTIKYDLKDPRFIKSMHWYAIGARFFIVGTDPNESEIFCPIVLPEYFLKDHGIIEDSLHEAIANGSLAVISHSLASRTVKHEAFLERKQQQVDKAREQLAAVTPKQYTADEVMKLLADWQPVTMFSPNRLQHVARKVELEYRNDGTEVKIK